MESLLQQDTIELEIETWTCRKVSQNATGNLWFQRELRGALRMSLYASWVDGLPAEVASTKFIENSESAMFAQSRTARPPRQSTARHVGHLKAFALLHEVGEVFKVHLGDANIWSLWWFFFGRYSKMNHWPSWLWRLQNFALISQISTSPQSVKASLDVGSDDWRTL